MADSGVSLGDSLCSGIRAVTGIGTGSADVFVWSTGADDDCIVGGLGVSPAGV